MSENRIIETIGSISKEETLGTVIHKIVENTLVLEVLDAFPGYHHALPKDATPDYIFIATKKYYTREEISRASMRISKYCNCSFNAAAAKVQISNDTFNAIRIKGLTSYDQIEDVQKCFQNENIKLRKAKKIKTKGIIYVKKYFVLTEDEEMGIYYDQIDPDFFYIKLPVQLSWKMFEKITYSLKYNWKDSNFDAAIGTIFHKANVEDVVRVYSKEFSKDLIRKLRDMYLKEISRM